MKNQLQQTIHLKKPVKWAIFVVLTMMVAQLTLISSFAQETAQLREESSVLDSIYKDKVSAELNNLMSPEDYTLVISTTIRNDEQKLKEYHEETEKRYLPGLNVADPLGYGDTRNILLELKQKAEIQVILSDNVPADRDTIVKEILKSKLKLNEESGDTVNVIRAARAPASVAPAHPDKLPELSSRMIAFWIIVALMALTGLTLWLFKRREKAKELEGEEEDAEAHGEGAGSGGGGGGEGHGDGEDEEEVVEPPKTPEQIEAERDALEMRLAFAKGELVKLVQDYPTIVCRAAEEFATQGRLQETVNFMEALGWDQSKRLFKEMEGRIWTRIGAALRERDTDPTLEESFNAVHVFHRFALSFVLERAGRDSENPFSFVFQLTDSQRIDLLTQETAENIAFIAIYCSGPQMGELLKGLEQNKQNEVLLNITKIKHLPEAIIRESVETLVMRLERIKADPSVYVDGPMLAADFMKSLSPAREEELYQTLMGTHPGEAEKLRRVRVMFQDIPYYPNEMVRKIVEGFESEEIQKALVGYDSTFVESFLSLLPTKKALMIQNDLYHMIEFPPVSQCAENRRKICSRIEQEFEAQRFSVAEFWKQFDSPAETSSIAPDGFKDEITAVNGTPGQIQMPGGPLIDTFPPAVFDEDIEDDGSGNGGQAA
jgi:flagellar motor switch protein FliG